MATKKQKALFEYLKQAYKNGTKFDVPTVAKITGWKESSTKTALRSRHYSSVVRRTEDGYYVSTLDSEMSFNEFTRAISQSSATINVKGNPLVRHLLSESRDAFILAIELFNRPSITNKHGPFAVLLSMAWEKLLKARLIILEGQDNIIFEDGNSLGFEKCINKCFSNPNDDVRRNLLELKEMRDGTVHLLVPEIGNLTTPFFQSAVLNFRRYYEEWTEEGLLQVLGSGLMSLVLGNEPIKSVYLQALYGEKLASEINKYAESLNDKVGTSRSEAYCVSIEVTLRNVKKLKKQTSRYGVEKIPTGLG